MFTLKFKLLNVSISEKYTDTSLYKLGQGSNTPVKRFTPTVIPGRIELDTQAQGIILISL